MSSPEQQLDANLSSAPVAGVWCWLVLDGLSAGSTKTMLEAALEAQVF